MTGLQYFSRRSQSFIMLFLLFAATADGSPAQFQQQGLTPEQVAQKQIVTTVAVSSTGDYAAFTRSVPADPTVQNVPPQAELHILNLDTDESRHVPTDASVSGVAFRPGYNTVTFLSRADGETTNALWEVSATGGSPERLFQFETNILGYQWAPDGHRVAFMAHEPVQREASPLPYEPEFYEENLVNRLAYVVDLSDDSPVARRFNVDGSTYIMAWSPDGNRIALATAPTPRVDDMYMFQRVRVLDASSRQVLNEIDNEGKIDQITWSPDGNRLALRAADHIHDPIDGRIMVVPAAGGTPENIFPDFEGKFEQIDWARGGEIYFLASESVETSFGTISPDGSNFRRIVETGGPQFASFARAAEGTVVLTGESAEHPREVFTMRSEDARPLRRTVSNEWLEDVPLGRREIVRYSARDGLEIHGLLIYPVEEDGGPYPLITVVHGGPEAHYSNGWLTAYSIPGQMAAARGYAVFYPNYRGSTGRGLEFVMSSQGDLAGAEFDDIVDGIDYLIERGIADPERVGVTGGSYGGYATAWMSTHYSDRFAAGVMFVGISNNISKWGTSDIPEELYLVHSRKRLWDHYQWNLERSPIYYVDRAQTPLLIMHGKEDTRVHPAQSLELYRHMRVRQPDVPVRLVLYPDEGHGNVRATSRYDYSLRMLQWFDTYLQGDGEMPPTRLKLPETAFEAAAGG